MKDPVIRFNSKIWYDDFHIVNGVFEYPNAGIFQIVVRILMISLTTSMAYGKLFGSSPLLKDWSIMENDFN